MNRFWVFPLVLGLVMASYPALCDAQGWLAQLICGGPSPFSGSGMNEVADVWSVSWFFGFLLGCVVGLYVAWCEQLRWRKSDRSGLLAARRLVKNGLWLSIYALIPNTATLLVVFGLVSAGIMSRTALGFYFPGFFFLGFGGVNFAAIVWAVMRTVACDDVLSPRVLLQKIKRSTQLSG